nr:hypothetical protein [Tanacetum cinerariifolium]
MIAILEKYEHNADFHQIVDFVEASHLRYALTINPTVYVSHICQFWSTARVETLDEETKILATVDGKPRTISESSIRRNLKLRDEAGISSLPDAELFENLTLMGYNISPNQKITFQKDEPASPLGDDSQGEACPAVSGFDVEQDRANIINTSTLPSDSTPRQDEMVSKITAQDLEISQLKARIKILEDKDGGADAPSGEDATIKGRSLETGEEAEVPTVSIPLAGEVLTGSSVVPTASPIFTTATVTTTYSRRKEEELQIMIDGLDRNNETVAKYLQEYEQFAAELYIAERIELINDLVKYQDNYAKVLKEDLNQLWALVKETLSIRPATSNKEKELWVELKRLYEPDVED